ncbi:hypothetical protein KXR73_06775 [Micrococcus luteus]|uniref:hypothetical protein n=1 Tax=Micrococcus luteus TaxID=1270 RepID=UPI003F192156
MYTAIMTAQGTRDERGVLDIATLVTQEGAEVGSVEILRSVDGPTPDEAIKAAGFWPFKWDFEVGDPPTIPMEKLFFNGHNAPVHLVEDAASPTYATNLGASRYRYEYGQGRYLDSLLLSKGSDTLVVCLHGATSRSATKLPRFERMATLAARDINSLFFSDPTLQLNDRMELAWYTGWGGEDVQAQIAAASVEAARTLGCRTLIFTGSSGGGFAALQVSALVPGSIAVPMNPQTDIESYFVNGDPALRGPQRSYAIWVHPEVVGHDPSPGWSLELGDHVSPLRRYSHKRENYVLFVQNVNDFHYEQHYLPWLGAAARGENLSERFRVLEYDGPQGHVAPSAEVFLEGLDAALQWAAESVPQLQVD